MYKQVYLYDGTTLLLESVTKYKLENGEIVDEAPAPIEIEKEVDVTIEETDEITKETFTVYEDVKFEEIEVFNYPKEYTELQPVDGLYQPIFFDGEKWIGTKKEVWEAANPPENHEGDPADGDNQEVLEELILQVAALTNNVNKGDE